MAVVYATLIVKGKKTLEQVPARLKAEVEDLLTALKSPFKGGGKAPGAQSAPGGDLLHGGKQT